jgi:putative phosphoesterase
LKIAVFSDIHSNKFALDNILMDIEAKNVDYAFCLGDLVGYGPRPNQVIDTIRESKIQTIMGNYDEGVGFEKGDCGCAYIDDVEKRNGQISIDWTTDQVTPRNKEFLRSLYDKIVIDVNNYKILFVHGSPRKINEYLYEDRPVRSLTRILGSIEANILICGHTHKPYHRIVNDIHIINDGSVGKPKDGDPRACYLLLEINENVSVEFIRVDYPIEEVANEIIEKKLPSEYAQALRIAR